MIKCKEPHGYFGIGIYNIKTKLNLGTLWRSAFNFGASFIFVIGKRYKTQTSDTTKTERHIPLYEYTTFEDFSKNIPKSSILICVEQTEGAKNLKDFIHPERAIYLLGAEDYGLPEKITKGYHKIFIDTPMCLNVAVAGSIVMYDRYFKMKEGGEENKKDIIGERKAQ